MKRGLRTNPSLRKLKEIHNILVRSKDVALRRLVACCEEYSIATVLDVGANVGQFGVDLRRYGYQGQIYSFEPVKKNFESLISTSRTDSSWHVINSALGIERAVSRINVSDNDGLSSSILPMGDLHKRAFPKSEYVYSEEIQISTLKEEILNLGIDPSTTLLKMDVQGYERNVILGGLDQLNKFPLCFLEASLSPLYNGEASLLELLNLLDSLGHHLTDIFRGAQDQRGRLLQVDILTSLVER